MRLLCAALVAAGSAFGTDLVALAVLDGASGDEGRVIESIRRALETPHRTGANGSLIAEFGDGQPHTLLVTGVDEPGYAVTALHDEGYLRARPLAEQPFGSSLPDHFAGQHVRVSTRAGNVISGVVAARSVHFGSAAGFRSAGEREIWVDIGARSRSEAASAGVGILDRVTLDKEPAWLGDDWLAAPWISNRVGAALLLSLARRLGREAGSGTVTLAWVTQQYPHNAGFSRALASVDADRVLLIAPNGSSRTAVGTIPGTDSSLVRELEELAVQAGAGLGRAGLRPLDFGPFAKGRPWGSDRKMAVLLPSVRNRATPAEVVRMSEMVRLSELLATFAGLQDRGTQPKRRRQSIAWRKKADGRTSSAEDTLEGLVRVLVGASGVSGDEGRVRESLQAVLPPATALGYNVWVDSMGNLVVRLGGGPSPSAAFLAHMDEIGYSIRSVSVDGSASAVSIGGGMPSLFSWRSVSIHGRTRPSPAVMTRAGSVFYGGAAGGTDVAPGDSVTVPKRLRRLVGSRVAARSLDDRLGCAVLVRAIWRLLRRARTAPGAVDFVFTVEEETGLNGARGYAERERPSRVYPIDTFVTSDSPLESRGFANAPLGAGPVLRAIDESGMTPASEIARVSQLARRARIPLQIGITAGGNDGSVFRSWSTVNIPIGFPLRYAHTAVETADLRDAEAAVDLVELLAAEELRPGR